MSERQRFRPKVQPLALTKLQLAPASQAVRTAPLLRGDLIESLVMIAVGNEQGAKAAIHPHLIIRALTRGAHSMPSIMPGTLSLDR